MSGASIQTNAAELAALSPRVQAFLTGLADKEPLMDAIGVALVTSTQRRFEEGKDPDGREWDKTHRGGQILVESGLLRDSVTYQVSGDTVRIGSNRIYAAIHQFGGVIKPKAAKVLAFTVGGAAVFARQVTIPARAFLGINAEDIADIRGAIADFIRLRRTEAR